MRFLSRSILVAGMLASASFATAMAQQPETGPNYETRLSSMEEQIRGVNGQVEQLGYAIRRLDQTIQHLQADYDARLTKLETQTTALQATADAAAAASAANGTLGAMKTTPDGRTTAINNPQSTPLPQQPVAVESPADESASAQDQYDNAFGLLRQANYSEAEKAFRLFIEKNPKDKLVDNAKYWLAETLYVRGQFADSALAFADAFQQNPQGSKAPDSLLKLAMSLAATNKNVDACTALGELKTKYANASATVRARANEEFAKLKCAAN